MAKRVIADDFQLQLDTARRVVARLSVFEGTLPHDEWEDPWHPVEETHYRITTNLDVFDMGQELCTNQKLDAFFESKNNEQSTWIAIYSCEP